MDDQRLYAEMEKVGALRACPECEFLAISGGNTSQCAVNNIRDRFGCLDCYRIVREYLIGLMVIP